MTYFGWSEDWEKADCPEVNEVFIKSFVNRYFDFPEDWDEDDVPLIMISVRCRFCKFVHSYYVKENRVNYIFNWAWVEFLYAHDAENFVYNWDNTYTSFSLEVSCPNCSIVWSYKLEQFWSQQPEHVIQQYQHTVPQFASPIEKDFWHLWKSRCPIALIPQYPVGKYSLDFAHVPTKTAIELDGRQYHSTPYQRSNDMKRQTEIEQQGWRFLRYSGLDIYNNFDRCFTEILNLLSGISNFTFIF